MNERNTDGEDLQVIVDEFVEMTLEQILELESDEALASDVARSNLQTALLKAANRLHPNQGMERSL